MASKQLRLSYRTKEENLEKNANIDEAASSEVCPLLLSGIQMTSFAKSVAVSGKRHYNFDMFEEFGKDLRLFIRRLKFRMLS